MSDKERIEGARQIEERIREILSGAGKNVEAIIWNKDRGGELLNYSTHTVHVTADGKEFELNNVPDERVVD